MLPFARVAIVGLGLIGSSLARAVRAAMPTVTVHGHDADPGVRAAAAALGLCDDVADTAGAAVIDAELVVLCVPVGAVAAAAGAIAADLAPEAVVSDVGSCKASVAAALAAALPGVAVVPAHPVAGTERSGPAAGFAELFRGRWCIVTPPGGDPGAVPGGAAERVAAFWRRLGANTAFMDPAHHDRVLAVTSHLPHLVAYSLVGAAGAAENGVGRGEVVTYSAGGFRDFTRIAASDPVMWRDVFLGNAAAVLEALGAFRAELDRLEAAIRAGDGPALVDRFTAARAVRRLVVAEGQDSAAADFGRRG